MTAVERATKALRDTQIVLAAYLQPGPRNPEQTINELFDVLDDYQLLDALEEIESVSVSSPDTAPEMADEKEST